MGIFILNQFYYFLIAKIQKGNVISNILIFKIEIYYINDIWASTYSKKRLSNGMGKQYLLMILLI
nr:MAG TPA: hypothetical protein [Bacteriophage sp.]